MHLVSTWAYGGDQRKGANADGSAELFLALLSAAKNTDNGSFSFVLDNKWDLCCSYMCVRVCMLLLLLFVVVVVVVLVEFHKECKWPV